MFAHVGLPNANPHSGDRKGGDGEGEGTGWEPEAKKGSTEGQARGN